MGKAEKVLAMMHEICLGLPDASVQTSWRNPHFKVGKKVFAGWDEKDGQPAIQFGLEPGHMEALLEVDDRLRPSRYPGALQIYASDVKSRSELESWLIESYRLRATKKTLEKLAESQAQPKKKAAKKKAKKAKKKKRAAKRR